MSFSKHFFCNKVLDKFKLPILVIKYYLSLLNRPGLQNHLKKSAIYSSSMSVFKRMSTIRIIKTYFIPAYIND